MFRVYTDLIGRTPGLLAHWPLNPVYRFGDVVDRSDAEGTAQGGLAAPVSDGPLNYEASGYVDLDGSDDRITTALSPFVNGAAMTVEGWAWRDTSTGDQALFSGRSGAASDVPVARLLSGGNQLDFSPAYGDFQESYANAWPGNERWVHFAHTYDQATGAAKLYISGDLFGTNTSGVAYTANAGAFQIGARGDGGDPWNGRLAHFAVYSRELSAPEIRQRVRMAGR